MRWKIEVFRLIHSIICTVNLFKPSIFIYLALGAPFIGFIKRREVLFILDIHCFKMIKIPLLCLSRCFITRCKGNIHHPWITCFALSVINIVCKRLWWIDTFLIATMKYISAFITLVIESHHSFTFLIRKWRILFFAHRMMQGIEGFRKPLAASKLYFTIVIAPVDT